MKCCEGLHIVQSPTSNPRHDTQGPCHLESTWLGSSDSSELFTERRSPQTVGWLGWHFRTKRIAPESNSARPGRRQKDLQIRLDRGTLRVLRGTQHRCMKFASWQRRKASSHNDSLGPTFPLNSKEHSRLEFVESVDKTFSVSAYETVPISEVFDPGTVGGRGREDRDLVGWSLQSCRDQRSILARSSSPVYSLSNGRP
jgi:hypothetical protein